MGYLNKEVFRLFASNLDLAPYFEGKLGRVGSENSMIVIRLFQKMCENKTVCQWFIKEV